MKYIGLNSCCTLYTSNDELHSKKLRFFVKNFAKTYNFHDVGLRLKAIKR